MLQSIRNLVRGVVDAQFPFLGWALREYRSERAAAQPVATPYGFSLAVPPKATIGPIAEMMASGEYEREETAVITECLKASDVFVDIGANIGWFSCLAAGKGKRVLAFEPLPSNQRFLLGNLARNELWDVEVHPVALGPRPGLQRIYGVGPVASLVAGWHGASERSYVVVPVSTLDTLAGRRLGGARVMVKLDVEGFEYPVLQGAAETLALEPRPQWLVEVHLSTRFTEVANPHFRDIFELFWKHGYRAFTADSERREVTAADVSRWVERGEPDFGGINYLFR